MSKHRDSHASPWEMTNSRAKHVGRCALTAFPSGGSCPRCAPFTYAVSFAKHRKGARDA